MQITLEHDVQSAVKATPNVLEVAAMFGLGIDAERAVTIVPRTDLRLAPGQVVFVTGSSGSGKSTILRLIHTYVQNEDSAHIMSLDALPPIPDRPLVDCFPGRPLDTTLRLLSLAGLNDAFVMLRTPSELSDGQRYRLRLAQVMAMVEQDVLPSIPRIVLADEFCATLDRTTARVIARNVRKWVSQSRVCFVAATTHDDLLEHLDPDILIEKHLDGRLDLVEKPNQ